MKEIQTKRDKMYFHSGVYLTTRVISLMYSFVKLTSSCCRLNRNQICYANVHYQIVTLIVEILKIIIKKKNFMFSHAHEKVLMTSSGTHIIFRMMAMSCQESRMHTCEQS